jgi:hypothetical protein
MNHCCVQVELKLNVSGEEWRAACERAVPVMLAITGLEWKVWVLDEESGTAGGFYLFRDRAAAVAYADGPVIAGLRRSPAVRDVRVVLLPVLDEPSRRTHAFGAIGKEARLDLVG